MGICKFSRKYIAKRLDRIIRSTGKPNKRATIIRKMSYEFGVDKTKYHSRMSDRQIIDTTSTNQTHPSQLEQDTLNELDQYEPLRAA